LLIQRDLHAVFEPVLDFGAEAYRLQVLRVSF
jgi:hypothetical protein